MSLTPSINPFEKPYRHTTSKLVQHRKTVAPSSTIVQKTRSTPLVAFTAASVFITWLLFNNSMKGHNAKNEVLNTASDKQAKYLDTSSNWGAYSGYPTLDKAVSRYNTLALRGPYDLYLKWGTFKQNTVSFFTDVFFPNLIPAAISLTALYTCIGPSKVHKAFRQSGIDFKKITQPLKQNIIKPLIHSELFKKTGKGLKNVARWPFKSLTHLGITTGALFGGVFLKDRLTDIYNGTEQNRFFRDFILGTGLYGDTGPY